LFFYRYTGINHRLCPEHHPFSTLPRLSSFASFHEGHAAARHVSPVDLLHPSINGWHKECSPKVQTKQDDISHNQADIVRIIILTLKHASHYGA
jgi:hypothetical protein